MSKTVLAQVDGFTPVIDGMIPEVGAMAALIFGKAWRYCQMADGVCRAAQERIASELGLSRATVNTYFGRLCEAGYLKDLTPELSGVPHVYADTGKANLSISFTASVSTCQKFLQPPVKNFDTKKELKEIKEDESQPTKPNIFGLYQSNIGLITAMLKDDLIEAEKTFPADWIEAAFKIAVDNNSRKWSYVKAVLDGWQRNGRDWTPGMQYQKSPKPATPVAGWESL